ncbi:hypothetical protein Aph01nite_77380 [Acrocarpospora phusangensis]|uniref:Peptidase C39-like domain-containing protein n=1 Tax=Acrocarpospora phusangensis TaxID=1070424 RepID=A0A919QKL9_9ACTN|nr:hypothetical protein [Acrocarpospora phusangensis]GIH29428.1 hypothetical protein Aph01nite_77380 [Acrocarpospora phusangensis]
MSYDTPGDLAPDVPPPIDLGMVDVPYSLDVLPDGRESLVLGDVSGLAEYNHLQGTNPDFQGTCGLCSDMNQLRRFGVDVTEAELVDYAVQNGLCNVSDDPTKSGGTTPFEQAKILSDFGVPAHVETGDSLEDLAANVEQGRGVIIEANAGELWQDANYLESGQYNHAVSVTGVARNPSNGEIQGFFINDSGTGESGKFVDAATMDAAWLQAGGFSVVTDIANSGRTI